MSRSFDIKPRRIPTQARARATRAAIIEAATRILELEGLAALTTNRVASVAGVGVASVYEYFPNKHAIVAGVVTRLVEDVLAELDAALESALGHDREAGLAEWVAAMFRSVDQRRTLTVVLLRDVPFLFEIPAVQTLRRKLVELAVRGRALGGTSPEYEHADALSRLLPVMVSSAVIESVLWPPSTVRRSELERALFRILRPIIVHSNA